ncbi:MAG: hypothetical protein FWG84_00675 [Bacteroidales bacterium]|nr:hypothetical protein [Bacteroidales bacterium]
MEKQRRIYWEKGLDITPDILIAMDNYHLSQQSIIAQLHAFRSYGVLPGSVCNIAARINNDDIFIDELYCTAVTQTGHVIDIQNDVTFERLSLRELTNEAHYVVLQVNPFRPASAAEGRPYARATYQVEIKNAQQNIEDGIPILKIYYNKNSRCWEIERTYVLPHVCLFTSDIFGQNYCDIQEELAAILDKLSTDEPACFQGKLLEIELKNYSLQEYPAELALLLKKIVVVFKMHLEKVNKAEETLVAAIEKFTQMPYNHKDAQPLLQMGIDCLREINQQLDAKPIPVVVKEEPKIEEVLAEI